MSEERVEGVSAEQSVEEFLAHWWATHGQYILDFMLAKTSALEKQIGELREERDALKEKVDVLNTVTVNSGNELTRAESALAEAARLLESFIAAWHEESTIREVQDLVTEARQWLALKGQRG